MRRRLLSPARYDALRRLVRYGLADARGAFLGRRPDLVPPRRPMFMGTPDYVGVGDEFLGHFRTLGHLEPSHRVLDVGCGIGRMARPLTACLDERGSYDGFDVDAAGVAWCVKIVTARFPRFRFRHRDVRSDRYNPRGRIPPAELRFPYGDGSFDFVFLTSVFTHMLPDDVDRYVREVSRVLDPAVPGDAIAIPEDRALAAIAGAGLQLEPPVRYGRWTGRGEFLTFQDVVVARKGPDGGAPATG